MKNNIKSLILRILIVVCDVVGLAICFFANQQFMSGNTFLLYFTIQSNVWLLIIAVWGAVRSLLDLAKKSKKATRLFNVLHLVFTVSITLTGIVFCSMLAPFSEGAWSASNVLLHVATPVLAVVDFFTSDQKTEYGKNDYLFSAVPPIYYCIFAICGYFLNWDFGGGKNYPYPFMNLGGSAGFFGFSTDTSDSLFLGTFWWIVILSAFVIGVSYLYKKLSNKICKK